MREMDMEYNSEREKLVIPEYGRNIQKLIDHARDLEDPELRQAFVSRVVDLMMQMHPEYRNVEDYREKLWKHAFRIARYDLDVLPPSGVLPTPEDGVKKPEKVGYPVVEARFRHYGNNVQRLIQKAISMEDGPIKDGFVEVIGSYMKLAYRTWNKEHYASDDIIRGDLESLSDGKLILKEFSSIDHLANAKHRRKRPSNGHHQSGGKYRGKGGGGRRRKPDHGRDRDR